MSVAFALPSSEARANIIAKQTDLITAIEAHPKWTAAGDGRTPDPGLYHVWDFVKRSQYITEELENIREGRELKHPEQIPKNEGASSNEERAKRSFGDVLTRSETINQMIQTPMMLMMLGLSQIDFGDDIRNKSKAVCAAIREASS